MRLPLSPSMSGVHRQQGAALLFSLIILLLLTVIGVTVLQTTTLQERMAGAQRDRFIAFQAAEATIREAERFLDQLVLPEFNGSNGLFHHASAPLPLIYETGGSYRVDWPATFNQGSVSPRPYTGTALDDMLPADVQQPSYVIEEIPTSSGGGPGAADEPITEGFLYRITALATGPSGRSTVVLQVVYRRGAW